MLSQASKIKSRHRIPFVTKPFLLSFLVCMSWPAMFSSYGLAGSSAQASELTELLPPREGYTPEALHLFYDQDANPRLTYIRTNEVAEPETLDQLRYSDGVWSAPINLSFGSLDNGNLRRVQDVLRLSTGYPMMLLTWDQTDYPAMFGITIDESNPEDSSFPISDEELAQLMLENSQLFVTTLIGEQWSAPVSLPKTFRPIQARLAAGSDGNALVVFWYDEDDDRETIADVELYALTFSSSGWSVPVRLTHNSQLEYDVCIEPWNDGFMVVWNSELDAEEASEDKGIYYSVLAQDGSVTVAESRVVPLYTDNTLSYPVLGRFEDTLFLLSQEEVTSVEDPKRPILQRTFDGAWSESVETGLEALNLMSARSYRYADHSIVLFNDGGRVRSAYHDGTAWHSGDPLYVFDGSDFTMREISLLHRNGDDVWMAVTGRTPAADPADESASADGVYYARLNFSAQLELSEVHVTQATELVGSATIQTVVENSGPQPSAPYTLTWRDSNVVLDTSQGDALYPGESRTHALEVNMATVDRQIDVSLSGSSVPRNARFRRRLPHGRNSATFADATAVAIPLQISPDYYIRRIQADDDGMITVLGGERRGISSAPVMLEVYLSVDGERTLLEDGVFDPALGLPLEIPDANLPEPPYRIEAVVNADHRVQEYSHANNTGVYELRDDIDLTLNGLIFDGEALRFTLENLGQHAVNSVSLWVTDDATIAAGGDVEYQSGTLAEATVDMEGAATLEARVVVDFSIFSGDYLYVVLNPEGDLPEIERGNNQARVASTALETASASLGLTFAENSCSDLTVGVDNGGAAPALSARVLLEQDSGEIVASSPLPVLDAGESTLVSFEALSPGPYIVRLEDFAETVTRDNRLEITVNGSTEEVCDGVDNDCDGSLLPEETDQDGDGYPGCSIAGAPADCNDSNPEIFPGQLEQCNGTDDDCDGELPEDELDEDFDGSIACEDCDDSDPEKAPDKDEVCDGSDTGPKDNDCDGEVDEGLDADGIGGSDCSDDDGDGLSEAQGDCDDANPDIRPDAQELEDGIDNNCDGVVDEGTVEGDRDGDGFTEAEGDCDDQNPATYPGAVEIDDGRDNDCDGESDSYIGDPWVEKTGGCGCVLGAGGQPSPPSTRHPGPWIWMLFLFLVHSQARGRFKRPLPALSARMCTFPIDEVSGSG